ncbi:MAG: DNA polymerase III subunit gamma/tau [Candidatus Magasanikiibacteriota bacterium]
MALYHKHRPQIFSDVIGQDHIVKTLSNQVNSDNVAHAYLFSGPRGVGKTTLARILAKAINCEKRKKNDFEPCNSCGSCGEISSSRSIDVIEIDAASHTGVDNVRENIIDNARFKPTKSKYKVFIIDEVHMLSTSAFNALLKTLEEPPEHVIFILATTELQKLPETIISRCQRFGFHKVGYEVMKKQINSIAKAEDTKIDKEVVDRIINKSDGCVRDAVSLLDQIMATGEKNITPEIASLVLPSTNVEKTLELIQALFNHDTKTSIDLINNLANDGINLDQFALDTIQLLRTIMVTKASGQNENLEIDLSDEAKKQINKLTKEITHPELIKLIDLALERINQMKTCLLSQLPLEMLIIEWCSTTDNTGTNNTDNNQIKKTDNVIIEQKIKPTEDNEIQPAPRSLGEGGKTTIKEKVINLVCKPSTFTMDDVKKHWNTFIRKIETDFPSLVFILKMAELKNVNENTLHISVGFSFHKDKIMEHKCKDSLENALGEIMSTKVRLNCVVEESEQKQNSDDLKEIASSLGGEIIT